MSLTAAASGFVVFLLSVQVIQGKDDWGVTYTSTEICAVKGSTVEISCTYSYPSRINYRYTSVEETFWFTKVSGNEPVDVRTDSQYAGRVWDSCSRYKKSCTLRITDLRERDSAKYKFRFITNQPGGRYTGTTGVTLSVTDPDLQVQVSRSYSGRTELKCHSSCLLPYQTSYIWYKNGQKMQPETSSSYSGYFNYAHSYSCAVKGREDFPSPPVCIDDQTGCNRVTYTDRNICASKGSYVDISCTYSSNNEWITSKFWFSPERGHQRQSPSQPEDLSEDSQYAGRVQVLETERGRSTLRITDLTERDSAEYHFKFKTDWFEWRSSLPGTTLTVTALQVQVTKVTVHQSYTEAELRCHSSCSQAADFSYIWFNNGQEITRAKTSSYKYRLYPKNSISCALKGHEEYPSPPVYAPKVPSVSVNISGDILEGNSLTLTCSSDANPAANYTWYKTNVNLKPLSKEPQLVFSSIQTSDSGTYSCTAENEFRRTTPESISIDVKYGPKHLSVSVSPSGEIVEGSSVNLTCSSDANPKAKYTWYRKKQTLTQGTEGIHHFTSISSEDSGIYHCMAENQHGQINSKSVHIDVQYGPKIPSVSVSPSGEIVESSSVTLTCSSDANPEANYTWYKENEDSPKASGQNFTITNIRHEHSGNYYCEAQNKRGRHNSTSHSIVVASSMKSAGPGSIAAVFLAVIFISVLFFIRRKKSSKETTERPDNKAQENMMSVCNNPSAAGQREPAEERGDLCYASVSFLKNQEDPLYSNICAAQSKNEEEEEEEDSVEYTTVMFKSASASPQPRSQNAAEDSSALYSTVAKKPRV